MDLNGTDSQFLIL